MHRHFNPIFLNIEDISSCFIYRGIHFVVVIGDHDGDDCLSYLQSLSKVLYPVQGTFLGYKQVLRKLCIVIYFFFLSLIVTNYNYQVLSDEIDTHVLFLSFLLLFLMFHLKMRLLNYYI